MRIALVTTRKCQTSTCDGAVIGQRECHGERRERRRRIVGVGPRKLRNLLLRFPRLFGQSLNVNRSSQPKWLIGVRERIRNGDTRNSR